MDTYPLVDRCAIMATPQQPFLAWLKKIDPNDEITLSDIQHDCSVYLVPGYEEEDDIEKAVEKYLKLNFTDIFTNELSNWYQDEILHPEITYETFLDWLKISIHTMVFDTCEKSIRKV